MNRTTEMTNYNHPQDDRVPDRQPLTPAEQIERDRLDRAAANRDEQIQFERELAAENSGAASGIAIGATIAALIGLGAGAIYYFGRPQPAPTTIITTPASPAASTAPQPEQPTKTIERTTIDRTAPAPPPQVIEVPKPILVPGATRMIEVPTPTVTTDPVTPSTPSRSSQPAPSPAPAPFSSPSTFTSPAPAVSPSSNSGGSGSTGTSSSPDPSGSGSTGTSPSPDPSGSVSPATPGSGTN
jgi:hypothetical protein